MIDTQRLAELEGVDATDLEPEATAAAEPRPVAPAHVDPLLELRRKAGAMHWAGQSDREIAEALGVTIDEAIRLYTPLASTAHALGNGAAARMHGSGAATLHARDTRTTDGAPGHGRI